MGNTLLDKKSYKKFFIIKKKLYISCMKNNTMNKNVNYLINKKRTKAELEVLGKELNIAPPNVTYNRLCKYYMIEKLLKASPELQALKPIESKYIDHQTGEEHGYNPMFIHITKYNNQQVWMILQLVDEKNDYYGYE